MARVVSGIAALAVMLVGMLPTAHVHAAASLVVRWTGQQGAVSGRRIRGQSEPVAVGKVAVARAAAGGVQGVPESSSSTGGGRSHAHGR